VPDGVVGEPPDGASVRAPEAHGEGDSAGIPLRWALCVALAGGLALAAAFPPAGAWPLAAAGPALLAIALTRQGLRASFAVGLVFSLAFFAPLLTWVANLAWYAWAGLVGGETVILAVLILGQRLLLRLPCWPLAVAGWWVAAEGVRDRWPWGGFPWGRLAMSQAGAPPAGWAAVGGAPLLTFLVALTGASLAWLLLTRASRIVPAVAAVAAAGLAMAGALLPADPSGNGNGSGQDAPAATVAAVQGNVPHSRSVEGLVRATTVTANHAAATGRLAAQVRAGTRPAPDLVIWPENSTDLDPGEYPSVYQEIASAVSAINRPVLVGAVLDNPVRNAGQLWLPGRGPVEVYLKRQLVPFGEFIPFRSLLSRFISLVALQPQDFTPGHRVVVFGIGKIRLGDVICYEIGFDGLVRSEVTAGANLLVMQTNDATFEVDGQRGETLQQLAMARIRAIEHNRAVVVASTTGVSAIIAPDGSMLARSGTWQQALLEARVPLRTGRTLADRVGAWPEYVISALTVIALIAGVSRAGGCSRLAAVGKNIRREIEHIRAEIG